MYWPFHEVRVTMPLSLHDVLSHRVIAGSFIAAFKKSFHVNKYYFEILKYLVNLC